jgi:uncharacterized membrane protein YeiH
MDGPDAAVEIPLWIDLLAVFVAGVGGSLIAIRSRFDVAGLLVITLVSAMGGGIIRDVLIGRGTPAALANEDYLLTGLAAAGVGFLFSQHVRRVNVLFILFDAGGLGLYTFVGMQKGLEANLPVITAMLLGVITATGGGLTRDLLSGEVPNVLRPGRLNMTAALVGVILYGFLFEVGLTNYVSLWIVVAVVLLLRLAAQIFDWTTPEASAVPARVSHVSGSVISPLRRIPVSRLRPRAQPTGATDVPTEPGEAGEDSK